MEVTMAKSKYQSPAKYWQTTNSSSLPIGFTINAQIRDQLDVLEQVEALEQAEEMSFEELLNTTNGGK
jgi:hypothetical protein